MKIRSIFFCFLTVLLNNLLYSQEVKDSAIVNYAKQVVNDLASEKMHGRGYVNNGDIIAADYIENEFKKFNLIAFKNSYRQFLFFPVNTFPGKVEVTIDGKKLQTGKDFILAGNSGSLEGTYTLVHFNAAVLKNKKSQKQFQEIDFSDKVILVDKKELDIKEEEVIRWIKQLTENAFSAKAIIFVEDKLTAELSMEEKKYPTIKMLRDVYTGDEMKISLNIENKFIKTHKAQNIIGYVKGAEYPDSFLVYTAHYDHLGQMGKDVYFPGANDNASGCAMLLSLARYYSQPANQPKYSIVFIAFAAEEVALMGSRTFAERPSFPLTNIKFLLNMDILGTGNEGITVVNGVENQKEFDALKKINADSSYIAAVKIRKNAPISDHYPFTYKGVKAFFIYTLGGIKAYHDIYDKSETLPLNAFEDLRNLIIHFGDYLQN